MSQKTIFIKFDAQGRTREQICAKIAQIDALIDSLYTTAIPSVQNGNILEYKLDTGQTKTEVEYTTPDQVLKSIQGYENLRQRYVNMLSSRRVRHVNAKNFN